MSYQEKIDELTLDGGFSGHYHNGFRMACGQAEKIAAEADEEIRKLKGMVNILADTAAYYRGSTIPQVIKMAESLHKAEDPLENPQADETPLHEYMDQEENR